MFNEYGDSIYSKGFHKTVPQHVKDKEILLDTIEHLRAMIVKFKGKKAFEDLAYKTYEQKCKSLRENITIVSNDLELVEKEKVRLQRQIVVHERTIKRQEDMLRLQRSNLDI